MQHLCAFKGPRLSRLRSRAVPSLTSLFGSSATRAGERKCTQHSAHIWPDLRSLWPNSLAGFTTQAEAAPQSDAKQAEAVPQPDVSQPEAAPQSDVNQPEAAPQPGAKRAEANRSRPPIAYMDRPISTRSVHYHRLVSNHRYVDKTAYVSKLILFSNRLFISGGFGWGKSTTLSTLYTYFCGRKHCFEVRSLINSTWNSLDFVHFPQGHAGSSLTLPKKPRQTYLLTQTSC